MRPGSIGLRIATWPAELLRFGTVLWRGRRQEAECLRALAALDDDQQSDLSEAGQRLRREARRYLPQSW